MSRRELWSSEDGQLNLGLLGSRPSFVDISLRDHGIVGEDVGLHAAPEMMAHPEQTSSSCPRLVSSPRAVRRFASVDRWRDRSSTSGSSGA